MDVLTIIYILVSVAIGAALTFFLLNRKKEVSDKHIEEEYQQKIVDSDKQREEIKAKYEQLLSESRAKIQQLDEQLQNCLDGHIDEVVKGQLEDVDKLKKKIEKLQSEIDDLEEQVDEKDDDIKSYKKKIQQRDEENNELQDKLRVETKANRQLQEDLQKLSNELDSKAQALELKIKSLCFVQEVLSAKPVKNSNTQALHAKVDALFNFVSGDLKNTIIGIDKEWLVNDYFEANLSHWAITAKKAWIQGKTTIAFVGEFSAGKTSIVNRILSQDDENVPRLPVSTEATTAIPTYISGGPSTYYNFVSPDHIQKSISEETFRRVNKEVLDEVKGVSSLIQYFVMTYKNENLNNLSILDTPGFNSTDKEDAERTISVINECDALFWVFDVNNGTVNRSSIELIKKHLKKPLFVVINKIDTKAETEVNKVEQLIRKTLRDEGLNVQQFIRFSGKAKLDDIMTPIKSVTHDKSHENFLESLLAYVNNMTDKLSGFVKEQNTKFQQWEKQCDQITDRFNNAINELQEDCQDAASIPHFEEHLFRKDGYEMSISEYNRLVNLLESICSTRIDDLCKRYNEEMNARQEAQQAWSNHYDAKEWFTAMKNVQEKLEKLIKNFKQK